MKKITMLMLILALFCCLAAAGAAEENNAHAAALAALDGVISVTPVEVSEPNREGNRLRERYLVKFEQPVDWKDPDQGTFSQRVFVGFADGAGMTCCYAGGYGLPDDLDPEYFQYCDAHVDFINRYNVNYVELEYRFFSESAPEGLSFDHERYWEYMTSENACADFHHVITQLRKVMGGSVIFYGGSKGGYAAENMARCFPDDADAYVSYGAPLCEGTADPRFYRNAYTTIGDQDPRFAETGAAPMRDLVLRFQLRMLEPEMRNILQPGLMNAVAEKGYHLSPLITEDEAYEITVAEFAPSFWQVSQNFDALETVLAMPEETANEFSAKVKAVGDVLFSLSPKDTVGYDCVAAPYYIQSMTEMGNYAIDLSYLREAGAELRTRPEDDATLMLRMCSSLPAGTLQYSDVCRKRLIEFLSTTEKDLIKIVGLSDPWYAVRAPATGNGHVHYFEVADRHRSCISLMTEEDREACYALLDAMLGVEREEAPAA